MSPRNDSSPWVWTDGGWGDDDAVEVTLVGSATALCHEEDVTCRGKEKEVAEEHNVEVTGTVEVVEEQNVEVPGIVAAVEYEHVETTDFADGERVPADAENEREEMEFHLVADDESDHEEPLYLVGAESEIFEGPHNGCGYVYECGDRRSERVYGTRGSAVGKTHPHTYCVGHPSDGLLPDPPWLNCSEESEAQAAVSTKRGRSKGTQSCVKLSNVERIWEEMDVEGR